MSDSHFHRLRVIDVVAETHDASSIVFEIEPHQKSAFDYAPGQFLTLRIPSDRGDVARCYSLSSSPYTDHVLTVTVKRTDAGYASNWLCDNAAAGVEIDVLEPAGVFTPKSFDGAFLLVAGGSGITPVISILKSVLSEGTGSVVLFYANRDEKAVIFREELNSLAAAHPDRVVVYHWLDSIQGIPSIDTLATLFRQLTFDHVYICGPKPFMDGHRKALKAIDFPRSETHIERFSSLGGDPFAGLTLFESLGSTDLETDTVKEHVGDAAPDASATTTVHVELDGDTHTFDWPVDVRLLDLLKSKGLPAPSSCSEGVCAACECKLVEGRVEMVNNQVLEEDDIADGYILACQSLPLTDIVKITYNDE